MTDEEPLGIVTVGGTVSREGLFETSATVNSLATVPDAETVAVAVVPSVTVPGRKSASDMLSLSSTLIFAVASTQLSRCAVIVAICVPSIAASSTIVIGKVALVCPDGMVTVCGMVAAVKSLLVSVT